MVAPTDFPGHPVDGGELPKELSSGCVLVDSDVRTDPSTGVSGTYTIANPNAECPECGLPGMHATVETAKLEYDTDCPHCTYSGEGF